MNFSFRNPLFYWLFSSQPLLAEASSQASTQRGVQRADQSPQTKGQHSPYARSALIHLIFPSKVLFASHPIPVSPWIFPANLCRAISAAHPNLMPSALAKSTPLSRALMKMIRSTSHPLFSLPIQSTPPPA